MVERGIAERGKGARAKGKGARAKGKGARAKGKGARGKGQGKTGGRKEEMLAAWPGELSRLPEPKSYCANKEG